MDGSMFTLTAERDGTSQTDRVIAALRTDGILVDERTIDDFVRFARAYCGELRYVDLDDRPAGDWSDFLPSELTPELVADFAAHPDRYDERDSPVLFRPHFTLFVVLLKLIERSQSELNRFTSRHLDHYYRQVLGLTAKPPVADTVNILVEPAPGDSAVLLPRGTPVSAGVDALGRERTYLTERDLVVNEAQIERMSSVHVERRVTDLAAARDAHRNDRPRALLAMLGLALGRPDPGDALAAYPGEGSPDGALLDALEELAAFAEPHLYLKHFELRELMRLKRRRDAADGEWAAINGYLEILAAHHGVQLAISDPRDFHANLRTATGGVLPDFAHVPEVESVDDLYELRTRAPVQEAIRQDLGFDNIEDFVAMMQIKSLIDKEWREINRLLEIAGRRRWDTPTFELARRQSVFDPSDFVANLTGAIGRPTFPDRVDPAGIDTYYDAIVELEDYFAMTAEEYLYVMRTAAGDGSWEQADQIMTGAHRTWRYAARRRHLQEIRERDGVDAMLRFVLGEAASSGSDPELVDRIQPYLGHAAEAATLRAARQGDGDVDWREVDTIAEVAQRNREGGAEPSPVRREWINLHAASDATAVRVTSGQQDDALGWSTFGAAGGTQHEGDPAPAPPVGTAIASSILALAEGRRAITVTLGCAGETGMLASLADFFAFEISTSEGWVAIQPVEPPDGASVDTYGRLVGIGDRRVEVDRELADLPAVQLRFELDESFTPVTALAVASGPGADSPSLRLTLRQAWSDEYQRFAMPYPTVNGLRIIVARLDVDVSGLSELRLRNDVGDIDPAGPFEPFSAHPVIGSRLLIGHPELASKRLDRLAFDLEWMGAPSNLGTDYYKVGYDLENPTFSADVALVDRRSTVVLGSPIDLFASGSIVVDVSGSDHDRLPAASTAGELTAWDRYIAWELGTPDFQHGAYSRVAAERAVALAVALSGAGGVTDASLYNVNPPYTPKLKRLTAAYRSSIEVRLDRPTSGPERFFHVHPFGFSEPAAEGPRDGVALVPAYDHQGELYLGLRGVRPPQTVSLLFQMAEGSADPDMAAASIEWSAAAGGSWQALGDGGVLFDSTRGLINSGIVELALGPAEPSTRLAPDLYWIRAAVRDRTAGVADTVAVHTQAVAATFADSGNAPEHFDRPLPPGSIVSTVSRMAGISALQQPYTSQGGRMAEDEHRFATRVSERLRHKNRALTMWDYEHLVLEEFPQIHKAKCISADPTSGRGGVGKVDVVVIPDIRDKLPFNSLEPKAPPELLAAIHEYLAARAPDTADVEVRNAHFRSVRAQFGVRFSAVGDDEFHKRRLIDELDRFLSPWAYEEGADVVIGSRIFANSLIDFIDRRPYVDFVADLRLFFSDDGEHYRPAPDVDEHGYVDGRGYHVAAGRPDAVLRAARDHQIDVITGDAYRADRRTGIGFMRVDLDLIVG